MAGILVFHISPTFQKSWIRHCLPTYLPTCLPACLPAVLYTSSDQQHKQYKIIMVFLASNCPFNQNKLRKIAKRYVKELKKKKKKRLKLH
jgi:hypothetical protein